MEIKPPSNELYTAIAQTISASSQAKTNTSIPPNWNVSQLIQAVITQVTDKQLFLNIQGVQANTVKPAIANLQVGDTLKLQIEQLQPLPQFRIVSVQKSAESSIVSQALRSLAAQNTEVTPLLNNISYIASRPALRPSPLAAEVNAAVRDIFRQLPSPFNLKSGPQLKQQLENTGLFNENKIKNQLLNWSQEQQKNLTPAIKTRIDTALKSELAADIGVQLHRLANLIRTQTATTPVSTQLKADNTSQTSVPTREPIQQNVNVRTESNQPGLQAITQREEAMQHILRQVESSLTHLQQTQLQNLNESQAGRPTWIMELPIKDGQDIDLFKLRINEEESNTTEEETKKIWNVTLQFDLTGLGKIKAHIKMQNEHISANFFSEQPQVLSLFQQHFDWLRNRLSYNGLNVGNIECARANLSSNAPESTTRSLDERT